MALVVFLMIIVFADPRAHITAHVLSQGILAADLGPSLVKFLFAFPTKFSQCPMSVVTLIFNLASGVVVERAKRIWSGTVLAPSIKFLSTKFETAAS